jgi:transposase
MQGRTVGDVSKSLGIVLSTLDRWVRNAKGKGGSLAPTLTAEQKRLRELEKENAYLREVNDILKKGETQSQFAGGRLAA